MCPIGATAGAGAFGCACDEHSEWQQCTKPHGHAPVGVARVDAPRVALRCTQPALQCAAHVLEDERNLFLRDLRAPPGRGVVTILRRWSPVRRSAPPQRCPRCVQRPRCAPAPARTGIGESSAGWRSAWSSSAAGAAYSGAAHPDGGVCGEDEDLQRSALRGGGMKKGVWEALGAHPPEGFGRNKDSGPGAGVRGEHGSTRQATAHARACTAGTASGAGPYDVRHEPEVVHRFVRLFIIVVPAQRCHSCRSGG